MIAALRRGLWVALLALLAATLPGVGAAAAALPAASDALCNDVAPGRQNIGTQTVVLLVHGYNSGVHAWTGGDGAMISTLSLIQGVTVRAFDYGEVSDEWVTNPDIGPRLGATIFCYGNASAEQGGTGKVVIVAHSMGGLATRCALDEKCSGYAGNAERVGMVVTLGTPNAGSFLEAPGSGAHTGVGSALGALCWVGETAGAPAKDVCDHVRALSTSNASKAFVPGSSQLNELPAFPAELEVHAVAGQTTLSVRQFFGPPLSMKAGDLVVGVDSATVGTDDVPPVVVDCGTWSFVAAPVLKVPAAGIEQFGSCWHGSETSYIDFVSATSQFVAEYQPPIPSSPMGQTSATGTEIIVTCHADEKFNNLTVYDTDSGNVLDTVQAPLDLGGQYTTSAGTVSFGQHDEDTGDYSFQNFGPDFASVPGVAVFPDGRQVAASVSLGDSSLSFAGPVPAAPTGFGAAPPSRVLDALYTADGSLWWVELPPGNESYVVKNDMGENHVFPLKEEGPAEEATGFSLYRDGGWYVTLANYNNNKYRIASGELIDSSEFAPAWWNYYTGGEELLPDTQYTIGLGRYRTDGTSIAFCATPPGNTSNTLFTVANTGGEPTEVVANIVDEGIVYYGPDR
ncbi:esterase/lipase family protein [Modestobacter lapidis]|nr:hypothetical protein [Modestobacter lapidis]